MHFVYILVCLQSGRSYVGQSANLLERFRRHRAGSTRTTREKLAHPVMIYWEACLTRAEAFKRERYFKAGAGHRLKQDLIRAGLELFQASPKQDP
jgi:predicted GIY-YIG superfamily endonuclease